MNKIRLIKSLLKTSGKYSEKDLNFIDGRAIIKDGKIIVARVYDRDKFFKIHNINSGWSKYPYSIEIPNIGSRECKNIKECLFFINKYCCN